MDAIPFPSSLAEVEALIRALYAPGPPDRIKEIQEVLQRVQKSPEGWQLAASLSSSAEPNLKFFGALTFTVKLNTESSSLSDDDAIELLQNLVGWFLQAVENGGSQGQIVVLKLCSALSTFFIHFSRLWKHCIAHLVQSLDLGHCVPIRDYDYSAATPAWDSACNLRSDRLQAILDFASTLADDCERTDRNSDKYAELHAHATENAKDVAALLYLGMDNTRHGDKSETVFEDALKCFQSWLVYARSQSEATDAISPLLRPLLDQIIRLITVQELCDRAVEWLTDTIESHPGFLTEDYYQKLLNLFQDDLFLVRYRALCQGDFDHENEIFGWLILAYGHARTTRLVKSTDEQSRVFLSALVGLTNLPGFVAAEDQLFLPTLEFWSSFVETMIDEVESSEGEREAWYDPGMAHVNQVLSNAWRKIQWPPVEEFLKWDSNDRTRFVEARKDVADLVEAVYLLVGPPLVSMFVELLRGKLDSNAWAEVEASAFCVASLADCIAENEKCDEIISMVFSADFFNHLLQDSTQVPLRMRHTSLQLIERYSDYFERRPEFLPNALNLLFGGLGDSALGSDSAKYVAKLCSSCRQVLTREVPAFLGQFGTIYHQTSPLDVVAEEKVVLGIASIIRAVKDEGEMLTAFGQLFDFARQDIARSLELASNPHILNLADALHRRGVDPDEMGPDPSPAEISLQLALRGLRCISGMAKGMQSWQDGPVDLDAAVSPWQISDRLAATQNDILTTLNQVLVAFPSNGEVVEIICLIFRAGFSESEPGPFVFPPSVVSQFFTSLTIRTSRIGTAVSTACSFLSSVFKGPPEHLVPTLSHLLPWVISLLQALPDPTADTELTQHSIDLIRRLMAKAPQVLFQLHPSSLIEFFFLFTLQVLGGTEPLPKAAAAEFWTEFLALRGEDDPATQAAIAGAMDALGPLVARSLMRNVGGEAMRSELDKVSEPLKKLVVQQPRAQAWLEAALLAEDFPSRKVGPEEKRVFLKKILGLRGARQTNQVVREFWLACRGSNFAYAS